MYEYIYIYIYIYNDEHIGKELSDYTFITCMEKLQMNKEVYVYIYIYVVLYIYIYMYI
jgi:hypothetical protein